MIGVLHALGVVLMAAGPQGGLGQPVARLTRLGDPVAYLDGEARAESTLFHWDKSRLVRVGDGVRQGPAGIGEVFFLDDQSEVRLFGAAHMTVEATDESQRTLRFLSVRRAVIDLKGLETRILLPGETTIRGNGTWLRITRDEFDRRYIVKNAGPGPVTVEAAALPQGKLTLTPGRVVEVTITVPSRVDGPDDFWNGYRIRLDDGVRLVDRGDVLVLEGEGVAHVGGAKIRVESGRTAKIWRPRR